MKQKLSDSDIIQASKLINVEPAVIKAILEVETGNRGGFIPNTDKPVILFEGHIFWKQLKLKNINPEKYANTNMYKDIVYQKWTKQYYEGGIKEYDRLNRAICINKEAALMSTSWGLPQIMGFNYKLCGCKNIEEFVFKMSESELSQLKLFIIYIKNNKLDSYLRNKNWKEFAYHYNGSSYAANKYDIKLKNTYLKYKNIKLN